MFTEDQKTRINEALSRPEAAYVFVEPEIELPEIPLERAEQYLDRALTVMAAPGIDTKTNEAANLLAQQALHLLRYGLTTVITIRYNERFQ